MPGHKGPSNTERVYGVRAGSLHLASGMALAKSMLNHMSDMELRDKLCLGCR